MLGPFLIRSRAAGSRCLRISYKRLASTALTSGPISSWTLAPASQNFNTSSSFKHQEMQLTVSMMTSVFQTDQLQVTQLQLRSVTWSHDVIRTLKVPSFLSGSGSSPGSALSLLPITLVQRPTIRPRADAPCGGCCLGEENTDLVTGPRQPDECSRAPLLESGGRGVARNLSQEITAVLQRRVPASNVVTRIFYRFPSLEYLARPRP